MATSPGRIATRGAVRGPRAHGQRCARLTSILGLSGAVEHAGGAGRVSFRSAFRRGGIQLTPTCTSRGRACRGCLVGLGRRAEPLSVLGIVPGVDSTSIPLRFHFDSSRHGRVVRHADPPAPTSLYTRGRRGPHAPHGHASPLRNREGACVPRSVCAPTLHRGVCSHSGRDHGTRPPRPTRTTTPRVRLRRSCPRSQPPRASSAWPRCCSWQACSRAVRSDS